VLPAKVTLIEDSIYKTYKKKTCSRLLIREKKKEEGKKRERERERERKRERN